MRGLWWPSTAGSGGNAVDVPGLAALGSEYLVNSVSCASAGNCAAGGVYYDDSSQAHAFLVSEQGGVWGTAIEVQGPTGLNTGGYTEVTSVSCATPGNCAAGGYYWSSTSPNAHAFVVSEKNGKWRTPFDLGDNTSVVSVSCGGPGACVAVGSLSRYFIAGSSAAFLAVEKDGTWTKRIRVPGLGALKPFEVWMSSVSCVSPGNCAAVGAYSDGSLGYDGVDTYGFVVEERNGNWGRATKLTGSLGNYGNVTSVSCASPGNCAVGGTVASGTEYTPVYLAAFVMSEKNGKWSNEIERKVDEDPDSYGVGPSVDAVSCASAGNCAAVGFYAEHDLSNTEHAFVVAERNGVWGTGVDVPGTETVGGGGSVWANAVSCASGGNCAIGGGSGDESHPYLAFVTSP